MTSRRSFFKGLAAAVVAGPAVVESAKAGAKVVKEIPVMAQIKPPDDYRCDWFTAMPSYICTYVYDNGEWVPNPEHPDFSQLLKASLER